MQLKQDTSSTQQLQAAERAEALKIAGNGALMDLQADMGQFEWMRALMWAIRREAEDGRPGSISIIKDLADIGNYLAEDRANILDDICERFERELDAVGGAK
ncbi:hypothetical protein D3C77_436910 [compost metagenome]